MAYETEKLKARIIEKFGTCEKFAKALEVDKSTISRCLTLGRGLSGKNLIKAVRLLEIPENEIDTYFFTKRVEKSRPKGAKK